MFSLRTLKTVDKYGMTYKLENVLKTWEGVGCPNMFRFVAPSMELGN